MGAKHRDGVWTYPKCRRNKVSVGLPFARHAFHFVSLPLEGVLQLLDISKGKAKVLSLQVSLFL
jgi:hypothetical protein